MTLVLSLIMVYTPYIRWFAPGLALESLSQMLPNPVSTDGHHIYNTYGTTMGSFCVLMFFMVYLFTIYILTIRLKNRISI